MNWSLGLIATGIWLVISASLGLVQLLITYRWSDRRTQNYKTARLCLFIFFILSSISTVIITIHDKVIAENQSTRLTEALKEASDERKARATSGHFESSQGLGQAFMIGKTLFFIARTNSFFDGVGIARVCPGIANQNSLVVSNTFDGKISVSAKIRTRDGLIAEINNNEWKIAPPPKTWDRNYSTNALEVLDPDGKVVFQVILLNEPLLGGAAHFQGIFFDKEGNGVGLSAQDNGAGMFTVCPKNSKIQMPEIRPLFKYPSDLHLGELVGHN